jgi:hypothetical protein
VLLRKPAVLAAMERLEAARRTDGREAADAAGAAPDLGPQSDDGTLLFPPGCA